MISKIEEFEVRIKEALDEAKKVLDENRCPVLPEDKEHSYADKFTVVEELAVCTIIAFNTVLENLSESKNIFEKRDVSKLQFEIDRTCSLVDTTEAKIQTGGYTSTKGSGLFQSNSKTEFFTTVTEYNWSLSVQLCFVLVDKQQKEHILLKSNPKISLKTNSKENPHTRMPQIFHSVSTEIFNNSFNTKIDRADKDCYTPRRNKQVESLVDNLERLNTFFQNVSSDLNMIFRQSKEYDATAMDSLLHKPIFLPVLPILDDGIEFTNRIAFHDAHVKSCRALSQQLGDSITDLEMFKLASGIVASEHAISLVQGYFDGISYIEHLLIKQLVSAIGKSLTPKDLDEFMKYHNHKIFKPEFRPLPLSIDVRRKGYSPEGAVSIEKSQNGEKEIIYTFSKSFFGGPNIKVGLNASTSINLNAKVSIHGYMQQAFSTEGQNQHELICRARQFSSFIILTGTMIDNDRFDVKSGLIIQNKDLTIIPLLFATIPTAKEFKKHIESLSDEQQKFLKMFRSMQLQSTLFTFCIVQIKPQLEKVLGLPEGSLTKEIKLTQDLMELFIEYQIPPDLLKFKGTEETELQEKLKVVRDSTRAVLDMIKDSKKEDYDERMKEAELLNLERSKLNLNDSSLSFNIDGEEKVVIKKKAANPRMSKMFSKASGSVRKMEDEGMCPPQPCPSPSVQSCPGSNSDALQIYSRADAVEFPSNETPPPPTYEIINLPNYADAHNYTLVPTQVEKYFEKFLPNSHSRPTIISTTLPYQKTERKTITSQPQTKQLDQVQEKLELAKTLDLLDALTVSGELTLDACEVHVVVCLTECFDETVMDTLIKKNQDPIKIMERSNVVLCTGIHGGGEFLEPAEKERIKLSGFGLE